MYVHVQYTPSDILGRVMQAGEATPALRSEIQKIVFAGNRRDRLAGVDKDGIPLAPLAPSTLRNRKGTGPPLAPQGAGSRVVKDFICSVGVGPTLIEAGWWGVPWLIYHQTGGPRLPRRDIVGLTPQTRKEVADAVHRAVEAALRGRTPR